jgi:hypothetical protein
VKGYEGQLTASGRVWRGRLLTYPGHCDPGKDQYCRGQLHSLKGCSMYSSTSLLLVSQCVEEQGLGLV